MSEHDDRTPEDWTPIVTTTDLARRAGWVRERARAHGGRVLVTRRGEIIGAYSIDATRAQELSRSKPALGSITRRDLSHAALAGVFDDLVAGRGSIITDHNRPVELLEPTGSIAAVLEEAFGDVTVDAPARAVTEAS